MTDWEYLERRQELEDYGCMLDDDEREEMRRQLDETYYEENELER